MIPRWLQLVSCLILALLLPPTDAKKSEPSISQYKLNHEPIFLFYFEDTDTILMNLRNGDLLRSFDAGENWEVVEDDGMKHEVFSIHEHPFDKNKAYVVGRNKRHWITTDQAKTWKSFQTSDYPFPRAGNSPFSFHGWDSSKVIIETKACPMCGLKSYYTADDFKTLNELSESTAGCSWAVGHSQFAKDLDVPTEMKDRTLCVVSGLKTSSRYAYRLVYSDDYFKSEGVEVKLQDGRPVSGVTNVAAVKRFIVAAVESQGTAERALYVTIDTLTWHRAEFDGHRIEEDAYTILESTNHSLQVDVLTNPSSGMGVLFTSNSDGTYFTRNIEHTNRGPRGYVDFEKLAVIQGIVLVNTVKNPEEVESESKAKLVVSMISFDDGRTFQPLKMDGETLHLHSVTAFANLGRVFSSPAPGLVMGVGNTGDHLKEYSSCNLYISDDAGLTWRLAREGPHKYEFGDQGAVVMAISDDGKAKEIKFSLDHGKEWKSVDLPHKLYPTTVTTTPDSTSLKFILVGLSGEIDEEEYMIYSIDFGGLHERKCQADDFDDKWPARLDENGDPDCLMGHKQYFRRRKASADCFVDEEFKDPLPFFEPCKCTAEDFECEYKRSEDGKSCVPPESFRPPQGKCQNPDDSYSGPSGWRLIPGNVCVREGGENLDKNIDLPCKNLTSDPINKEITSTPNSISHSTNRLLYRYLERQTTNLGDDETIMVLTDDHELFISHDHGKNWKQFLKGERIIDVVRHQYNSDMAFVLTDGTKSFWTIDRGQTFKSFKTETPPNQDDYLTLKFHPMKKDWLIWMGAVDCDSGDCHSDVYISKNRGQNWELVLRYAKQCEFESRESRPNSDYLLFCEQYEMENKKNRLQLVYSTDDQFSEWGTHFKNLVHYATRSEFIVVASRNPETGALKASVSVDGLTFADAQFPPNISPVQNLYTVLDATTHAVFLYVETNNVTGAEYGSIVKSNSNGTSYVLSLDKVNQNTRGYADFERMQGLEGVIITNIVSNAEDLPNGAPKKLRTMITHNDGAQWALLPPPANDADGKKFSCSTSKGQGTDKCSLHLHGYTERKDERDTFSSGSAIGLMMGVGNVGDQLTSAGEADTFITRDGGITWKSVKKGRYMWEFGDSGSVIVIVPESKPTQVLHYSTDEGDTWQDYKFSDVEMTVFDISTVPSDTSKNFLLWGRKPGSDNKVATVNVDFSGLYNASCEFEKDRGVGDDYYLWEPRHPFQDDNCLFGHVEQYRRKKPSATCWNNWRGPHVHSVGMNCTCTRADYECDYNFEPQSDGSCALVPGLDKEDATAYCKAHPDADEYWEKTGYRRIPQTTCQGGRNLDQLESKPCPGKQAQYDKKHGISGVGLFFAIVTPTSIACAVGYYVYTRWDGKFGQIRLGETAGTSGFLSRDSLLVTIPITIIAGVVAVAKTLPLLVTSLWRSVSGYVRIGRNRNYSRPYASRASFAARRGDYTSVVDDEDELLGVEDAEADEDDEL